MYIGAHISKRKTYSDTFDAIIQAGGNAIQIFTGSPRSASPKNPDEQKYSIDNLDNRICIIIHAPYTINPAMPPKNNKRTINIEDTYWFQSIIAELSIADRMGAIGVVIHVGCYTTQTIEDGLSHMRKFIIAVLKAKLDLNITAKLILETASGKGSELLSNIEDLGNFYNDVISMGAGAYDGHFGLCLDTCHVWSSGYSLLDAYVTLQNITDHAIVCIHLNGSATPKGSRKDRHSMVYDDNSSIPVEEVSMMMKEIDDNVVVILETPNEANLSGEIMNIQDMRL